MTRALRPLLLGLLACHPAPRPVVEPVAVGPRARGEIPDSPGLVEDAAISFAFTPRTLAHHWSESIDLQTIRWLLANGRNPWRIDDRVVELLGSYDGRAHGSIAAPSWSELSTIADGLTTHRAPVGLAPRGITVRLRLAVEEGDDALVEGLGELAREALRSHPEVIDGVCPRVADEELAGELLECVAGPSAIFTVRRLEGTVVVDVISFAWPRYRTIDVAVHDVFDELRHREGLEREDALDEAYRRLVARAPFRRGDPTDRMRVQAVRAALEAPRATDPVLGDLLGDAATYVTADGLGAYGWAMDLAAQLEADAEQRARTNAMGPPEAKRGGEVEEDAKRPDPRRLDTERSEAEHDTKRSEPERDTKRGESKRDTKYGESKRDTKHDESKRDTKHDESKRDTKRSESKRDTKYGESKGEPREVPHQRTPGPRRRPRIEPPLSALRPDDGLFAGLLTQWRWHDDERSIRVSWVPRAGKHRAMEELFADGSTTPPLPTMEALCEGTTLCARLPASFDAEALAELGEPLGPRPLELLDSELDRSRSRSLATLGLVAVELWPYLLGATLRAAEARGLPLEPGDVGLALAVWSDARGLEPARFVLALRGADPTPLLPLEVEASGRLIDLGPDLDAWRITAQGAELVAARSRPEAPPWLLLGSHEDELAWLVSRPREPVEHRSGELRVDDLATSLTELQRLFDPFSRDRVPSPWSRMHVRLHVVRGEPTIEIAMLGRADAPAAPSGGSR